MGDTRRNAELLLLLLPLLLLPATAAAAPSVTSLLVSLFFYKNHNWILQFSFRRPMFSARLLFRARE